MFEIDLEIAKQSWSSSVMQQYRLDDHSDGYKWPYIEIEIAKL